MAKSKEQKIRQTLSRYSDLYSEKKGKSLSGDFLQVSKILERLSESDTDAFNALYWHIEQVIELESIVAERGKRISVLQKGQLQPKEKDKRKVKEIKPENFACRDLSGKDFQKKELFQANFNKCLLKKTNFRASKAMLACFTGANLEGADFTGAKLDKANFSGANLTNAVFKSAKLAGANFDDAILDGAVFDGSNYKQARGIKF